MMKYGIIMIIFGILAYFSNPLLIRYYIRKHCYEKNQEVSWDKTAQLWELVAGTGCVPRWVSVLGLGGLGVGIIGICIIIGSVLSFV